MVFSIELSKLSSFIIQYLVATLVSGYVFYSLWKRRFSLKPEFIVSRSPLKFALQVELIGQNFFCSVETALKEVALTFTILSSGKVARGIPSTDLRTELRGASYFLDHSSLLHKNALSFKAPSTRVHFPELRYRKNIYDAFVSFFSVSIWAGILLLLTPYQQIFVFIPHFANNNLNLVIVILFGITVFESGISVLFMHTGTSRKVVFYALLAVAFVFTASLLTPSFNWFRAYTEYGEILLYIILGVLILSVTYLISLFRDKNRLYRLALYSSFLSYGFFIAVTSYNILNSLLTTL